MSCTTAIHHLTWFFHSMISRHNMIFHSMIFSACTSSLYKTLYNTWFYHAMETFYICIKTCITWFWANMIFFSCHKNHVRWGIALLLLRFYGPFGKFILKVIMQIRRLTKPNTLWCHLHFFNLLCALKPAINLRIFQKATFFSYYLHTYLFAWIQKRHMICKWNCPPPSSDDIIQISRSTGPVIYLASKFTFQRVWLANIYKWLSSSDHLGNSHGAVPKS